MSGPNSWNVDNSTTKVTHRIAICIPSFCTPQRIDTYLTSIFPYSRSFFHHLFERKDILVNQRIVKKSYTIQWRDCIHIASFTRFLDPWILSEAWYIPLDIRHLHSDYCIIYKPKWIISHPNSIWDIARPSVVASVYHHFTQKIPSVWNFLRAWLVHRLDKDTDWLMIIALSEKWWLYFKELMMQKSLVPTIEQKEQIPLRKFYKATVQLRPHGKKFLASIQDFPYYHVAPVTPKIPHTKTKIWITKLLSYTLDGNDIVHLDIEILTWKTHQIRCHLSDLWLPILWDYLYNSNAKSWESMQLQAYRIQCTDCDWKKIDISLSQ